MVFLGTFNHTLDDKNRLALPSKFIAKLPKEIYISKGFDGCLEIRTPDEFNKRYEFLMQYSENKKASRDVARTYFSNSRDIEIDKTKRILLPSELIELAHIKKNVMIIGVGNKIEIWDEVAFKKFQKAANDTYESVAEKLDDQTN
ncbi:MAG: division/cell wall cluster transcriptional repressor MraZ [Mycoplasmataceae bacterium]|nr:division/cell wall cluster transcriptional repressor MraZ [Mycoplasmataceae bacterium]